MIIARSPLRIPLGGGGTDLPSYYEKHEGFLIAGAIDKYVYVSLSKPFVNEIILKYSKIERTSDINAIEHPMIREAFRLVGLKSPGIELTSIADIPAGTGLGSSGSFACALLTALYAYNKVPINHEELAKKACHIEIDLLKEPVGKQDQYISSYGGVTCFKFCKDGKVEINPLNISDETMHDLENNLHLYFTGISRASSSVLKEQNDRSKKDDKEMTDNLHFIKDLGYKSKEALESGNLKEFAELMNTHWEHKKKRSGSMSNPKINEWYDIALKNGAIGGKLIGAGGGGFLMFYAEDHAKLRKAMTAQGLEEINFRFDFEGSKLVTQI